MTIFFAVAGDFDFNTLLQLQSIPGIVNSRVGKGLFVSRDWLIYVLMKCKMLNFDV